MGHGLLPERKHVARGLPFPDGLSSTGRYSVLTLLSEGYPHLRDRFPCLTHPFATLPGDCSPFTSDLHVLSTPPAFVLSQDQTLQFHFIPDSGPRSALLLFSCQRSPLLPAVFLPGSERTFLSYPKRPSLSTPPAPPPPGGRFRFRRQGSILYAFPVFLSTPLKFPFSCRSFSLPPPPSHHQIDRRKHQKGHCRRTGETPDDDSGQRTLDVGSRA